MSGQNKRAGQTIQLASVDNLFGLNDDTANTGAGNGITELPVNDLHAFHDHPYKVIPDDDAMLELIESIRENGVLVPLEVRPRVEGGYEIISGHRRHFAAIQVGLSTVPCIVSDIDDDTATLRMVDSNLYRPDILPSEKAFAYKMKLDAMSRKAGRPSKNGDQVGHHFNSKKSRQILAEQVGESGTQIARYIRLTYLSPDLLELVDARKIPVNVGVPVSYLEETPQIWLYEFIRDNGRAPSIAQAEKLKQYQEKRELTKTVMELVLSEDTGKGPSISIKTKSIAKFFPPDTGKREMEDTILKLLENWMNNRA